MARLKKLVAQAAVLSSTVLASAALAQPPTGPAFDLADVHSSPHVTNAYMRGGTLRGGRYDVRTASLLDLIGSAYSVDPEKIQGGPAWLDVDRFDISAKVSSGTPPETVKLMLQALLADRFQLKVHTAAKAIPAYVLTLGKGKPKLKESDGTRHGCDGHPQDAAPGVIPPILITCSNRTMEQFAQDLHNMAGGYLADPVVDQTGLKGAWDFDLKWTGRGALTAAGADGISIFDAVDKQLGLKLQAQKVELPVIVVDHVNEKPTENPPGVAGRIPAAPLAEFEVATIRPSVSGTTQGGGKIQHGRVDIENLPLKTLIMIAWDINADELISGMPKFADSNRFSIAAKAPLPESGTEVDFEDLRLMFRALLIDRFELKTHMEERQVDGYVLSAVKPKMQKADPSNRTLCKEGPGPDGKDPRLTNPIVSRLLWCQNMTMAQFVEQLPTFASGYAHVNVLDATGLTDAYDFSLSFSAAKMARLGGNPGQPTAGTGEGSASDPSGAVTLPEAVNKQLGLKLELKKRPAQVLVIGHLNPQPTEN